jgi:hypothetical protein
LIEFGLLVLEKKILKIISVFLLFCYYLPLERGNPRHFNKLESTSPKDDLCQVWFKLAQWFCRRFLNDTTTFLHFCDYLPFEEGLALYLNKLEFPSPKNNFYQVRLNLASWFWRRRFLKMFSVFLLLCYYLPLEMVNPLHLNKLEFPSPKNNLYQVRLNLACWFWRRFLKMFSVFLLFCYYLPFEMGNPLHLNKLESPSPRDDLCQVWLKLAQWFWRRIQKCKSLTDRLTDDGQRVIRKAHLIF